VLTKSDKLKHNRKTAAAKSFAAILETDDNNPLISYSAVTGEGRRELWSLIDQRIAHTSRPSTAHPQGKQANTA